MSRLLTVLIATFFATISFSAVAGDAAPATQVAAADTRASVDGPADAPAATAEEDEPDARAREARERREERELREDRDMREE